MAKTCRIAIVGGSIIGLSAAFKLSSQGYEVSIYDPLRPPKITNTQGETSSSRYVRSYEEAIKLGPTPAAQVAAGMLGSYTEAWPGEEEHIAQGRAALEAWNRLLPQLEPYSEGRQLSFAETILVGVDHTDSEDIDRSVDTANKLYPGVIKKISRFDLKKYEPSLARGLRQAHLCSSEWAVDNRAILAALWSGASQQKVRWVQEEVQESMLRPGGKIHDSHDIAIIAAGYKSVAVLPVLKNLIRPVKGETLRLSRRSSSTPQPQRTIRARVHGRPLYIVPRPTGVVIGATEYEQGEEWSPTVGGIRQLLEDAARIMPGIDDYKFDEVAVGLRPYSPDNLPIIGPYEDLLTDSQNNPYMPMYMAVGHGRHGILHSALTAEILDHYVGKRYGGVQEGIHHEDCEDYDALIQRVSPRRFVSPQNMRF